MESDFRAAGHVGSGPTPDSLFDSPTALRSFGTPAIVVAGGSSAPGT